MPIPINYRRSGEGAVANYNYTDIAEGSGVVIYEGFNTGTSGASIWSLGAQQAGLYSYEIETSKANPSNSITFNTNVFNLPRLAKGTAIVSFSAYIPAQTTCFIISIQKVSGSNITTIGTGRTKSLGGIAIYHYIVDISLTTTQFKKGDILRLVLQNEGNGTSANLIAHDPANRNGASVTPATTYPTKFELFMPFKIDL